MWELANVDIRVIVVARHCLDLFDEPNLLSGKSNAVLCFVVLLLEETGAENVSEELEPVIDISFFSVCILHSPEWSIVTLRVILLVAADPPKSFPTTNFECP